MKDKLKAIKEEAISNIDSLDSLEKLEDMRIKYIGKKGELTMVLREMGKLSKDLRPVIGQMANEIRKEIDDELAIAKDEILQKVKEEKM